LLIIPNHTNFPATLKKKLLLLFLFLGLGLASCTHGSNELDSAYQGSAEDAAKNDVVVDTDRKMVYEASYTITYEEENTVKSQITSKVTEFGGYTYSINEYSTQQIYVYKVPTAKFNSFLDYVDTFEGAGRKVVSSTDITNDYSYTEARIATLNASKAAYQTLLEATTDVSEIVYLRKQIEDIDTELLSLNLSMSTYKNKVAYSTVTITYCEQQTYKEPSFFDEYWEYVGDFFTGFGKFILYLLPVAITLGGIFCAIFFPVRAAEKKKREKRKQLQQNKGE